MGYQNWYTPTSTPAVTAYHFPIIPVSGSITASAAEVQISEIEYDITKYSLSIWTPLTLRTGTITVILPVVGGRFAVAGSGFAVAGGGFAEVGCMLVGAVLSLGRDVELELAK